VNRSRSSGGRGRLAKAELSRELARDPSESGQSEISAARHQLLRRTNTRSETGDAREVSNDHVEDDSGTDWPHICGREREHAVEPSLLARAG